MHVSIAYVVSKGFDKLALVELSALLDVAKHADLHVGEDIPTDALEDMRHYALAAFHERQGALKIHRAQDQLVTPADAEDHGQLHEVRSPAIDIVVQAEVTEIQHVACLPPLMVKSIELLVILEWTGKCRDHFEIVFHVIEKSRRACRSYYNFRFISRVDKESTTGEPGSNGGLWESLLQQGWCCGSEKIHPDICYVLFSP